jgi:hypothetical protein
MRPERPSDHLTWFEVDCHDADQTPYPEAWLTTLLPILCAEFERVRAKVACPIDVDSGYRTAAYNATCKGSAPNSQHVQGRALDLHVPVGWTVDDFYCAIKDIAKREDSAIYGVGHYPLFVHIDIRPPGPTGRLVCWQGSRAWAETKKA